MKKPCAFNMPEAGFAAGLECPNQGTLCGWCACSGPCVHEMNPVCELHAGYIAGWIEGHPPDPNDEEGLAVVHEAAAKFIRTVHTSIT